MNRGKKGKKKFYFLQLNNIIFNKSNVKIKILIIKFSINRYFIKRILAIKILIQFI